jgi:hypothetical protein
MLADYGFRTHEQLEHDIRRFSRDERQRLIDSVRREFAKAAFTGGMLCVVKLVPNDLQGQLPNCRLNSVEDLAVLNKFFKQYDDFAYSEVWHCQTIVGPASLSVAGRIIFTNLDDDQSQLIEQVWRCSPRLIEEYSESFKFPYLRAARYGWGWRYDVEHVHCPNPSVDSESSILAEFSIAAKVLESNRERVEGFCSFLDSFHFRAYSLEYKIVNGKFFLIDWDTPNDRVVLHA